MKTSLAQIRRRFPAFAPLLLVAALAALAAPAAAEVQLHGLFTDHAVLQRDQPLPVWGWAAPGESVTVTLGPQSATATTGADGRWQVTLPPQPVSKEPLTLTAAGKNRVAVNNILLGDVWLCSGQSNMEWGLGGCNAPEDIASADFPLIRHFRVEPNFATRPLTQVKGRWTVSTPNAAPHFSAVAFYFARMLHARTGIPIGLLVSSVGGTNIELWMSQDTLLNTPALDPYARAMRESLERYQRELTEALPLIEDWTAQSRTALQAGQNLPLPPHWPEFPFAERVARPRCVTLHNGMIAPLVPFALRGAIWYQGESNAGDPLYFEKKRALLADWRQWFGHQDLPLYFVQLAAWQQPNDNPAHTDSWALVREQQRKCLALPHTGMAVAIDLGDADDIHPKNKADVGERLARWALARDYQQNILPSGPLFRSLTIEGPIARIAFDQVGPGLMVATKTGRAPARETPDLPLQRFAIAGPDNQWRWANAVIDGDSVRVSSPDVPQPVAVRYAWCINPAGANLYNRDGLPASPFTTE